MDERFEVLDAFVDGELVDPSDVKRALSQPEGRDYLERAVLRLGVPRRELGHEVDPQDAVAQHAPGDPVVVGLRARRNTRGGPSNRPRLRRRQL